MPHKIFTFDELDEMLIKEPRNDDYIQDNLMALEASMRELKNKRTHDKTLEDALDAYDGLVEKAYKIKELGLDSQASTYKAIGRAGTGNTQWNFPANFSNANWLIADDEGAQMMRNRTMEADYGMTLEQYKTLFSAHETSVALLRKELADRRLQAQMEQAQRNYENDLDSIEGDN